jgi:hypothetical protein
MKVLDLQCQQAHSFEGWFASEDDFQSQLVRGLVQCPICSDASIVKKLSAPRLNLMAVRDSANAKQQQKADSTPQGSDNRAVSTAAAASALPATQPGSDAHRAALQAMVQDPQFQAAYLNMARSIVANTEDVGTQFAQEARKMHYGEANERAIRGHATRDETLELLDEGIDVLPLLLPDALKGPVH